MKNVFLKISLILLVLPALFLARPSTAHAEEMTCQEATPVVIDIKPVDTANKINLSSRGLLPVAVFSTADFDASQFSPMMAHLQDASQPMDCSSGLAVRWAYSDANGDGRVDLVFFFKVQDLKINTSTTELMLMAHGDYGTSGELHIMGMDGVVVKP
jgi:hypothetical protein